MTVTQSLVMVRGMKVTPLLHYPPAATWCNSHHLLLQNSSALPPVHELFKRPLYMSSVWQKNEIVVTFTFVIFQSFQIYNPNVFALTLNLMAGLTCETKKQNKYHLHSVQSIKVYSSRVHIFSKFTSFVLLFIFCNIYMLLQR
jgi:hypothetical protein